MSAYCVCVDGQFFSFNDSDVALEFAADNAMAGRSVELILHGQPIKFAPLDELGFRQITQDGRLTR